MKSVLVIAQKKNPSWWYLRQKGIVVVFIHMAYTALGYSARPPGLGCFVHYGMLHELFVVRFIERLIGLK
jgi:hypothetical protein